MKAEKLPLKSINRRLEKEGRVTISATVCLNDHLYAI